MKLPKAYQYPLLLNDAYGKQPPGKLNIARLINRQAPYRQPQRGEPTLAAKTLIIAAPDLGHVLTEDEFKELVEQFAHLERAGLSFYYVDSLDNCIKPYEVYNPGHQEKIKRITPTPTHRLNDMLATAGIPVDHAKILFCLQLNNAPFATTRFETPDEITDRCFNQSPIIRHQTLEALSPDEALAIELNEKTLYAWIGLTMHLATTEEIKGHFHLRMNDEMIPLLLAAFADDPNLRETIASITLVLQPDQPKYDWTSLEPLIKKVILGNFTERNDFATLFSHLSYVETLQIRSSTLPDSTFDKSRPFPFPALKTLLIIYNSTIHTDTLAQFFQHANDLTTLSIENSAHQQDIDFDDFDLPILALTTLKANSTGFSIDCIEAILQASPMLSYLNLESYAPEVDEFVFEGCHFSELTYLNTSDSNLSHATVFNFIKNATHLQSLNIIANDDDGSVKFFL